MAIVRELLIRLGFQTDKRAINETNRAIIGFKTRFAIAATAATYAFKVVKDFFSDIAAATLDSDELARSLGVSLDDLIAMQQAAQKFRIKPEQFAGALSTLQKDLNEARQGFGRLPEILRQLRIDINNETSSFDLFDKIIQKIREIDDEQQRIRVASNIFGEALGARIANLAINFDDFRESVKESRFELKKTTANLPQLMAYETAINELSNSFIGLVRTIGQYVYPALTQIFNYLNYISRFWGSLFSGDFSGLKDLLKQGSAKVDDVGNFLADKLKSLGDGLDNLFASLPKANSMSPSQQYGNDFIDRALPSSLSSYVNNKVDINIPPGTTSEQAQYLADEMERMIEDSIMNTFYQIQNNNPQVE